MALARKYLKPLADGNKIAPFDLLGGGFNTFGNVYYVVNNTEANYSVLQKMYDVVYDDGSSAFCATASEAMGKCVSGRDDIIVLSANVSNKVTEMLTVSKNRIHFLGTGFAARRIGARSLISNTGAGAATDIAMVRITGTGNSFHNISFKNNWTATENLHSVQDWGANTYFENCDIENLGSAHLTNAAAAALNLAAAESVYENTTIGSDTLKHTASAGQEVLIAKGASARAATRCQFNFCRFQTWTSQTNYVFIRVSADGDIDRDIELNDPTFANFNPGSQGALMAVAIAIPNTVVSGGMLVSYPRVGAQITNLATNAVGNAGLFVVTPALAANGSDAVGVQAS